MSARLATVLMFVTVLTFRNVSVRNVPRLQIIILNNCNNKLLLLNIDWYVTTIQVQCPTCKKKQMFFFKINGDDTIQVPYSILNYTRSKPKLANSLTAKTFYN